jgi:sensor domain CHASE-containing protein/nitrogen-specific signal transduction histidine kinase
VGPMSLRARILLIVAVVVVAYAGVDHLIQRMTISPSFERLEHSQSERDLERVIEAIQAEVGHLDTRCRDWSAWNDTYRYVAEPYPEYISSNLGPNSFRDRHIDLLYICALDGRVVWSDVRSPATQERLKLRQLPSEAFSASHPLLAQNARGGRVAGLQLTEHGPLLLAARPILPSAGIGPSRGTLILGRFLGQELIEELSRRTRVEFEAWPLDTTALPEDAARLVDRATASTAPVIETVDDETLHVYTTFPEVNAAPALLVRARVRRDVAAQGATSIRYALVSTLAAGMLFLLVLVWLLRVLVLDSIGRLTRHAVAVGRSDDTSARLDLARTDEIGILSREFDRMLEKLASSKAAQVHSARAAGMSELATGILHNVGNVLNSVNVSAMLIGERLQDTKVPRLRRLAEMLAQESGDLAAFFARDPRSKHVAPFLSELASAMETDHAALLEGSDRLSEGVSHIRRLVQSQQSYAGSSGLREPVTLEECVRTAVELVDEVLGSEPRPEIAVEIEELPRVILDRYKLMEILVNLIKNARESVVASQNAQPSVAVRARREDAMIVLRVTDNGIGIAAENLERVFNHGFTTKPNGHGFGLHASANAAREMHGRLRVESDGLSRGATFTLELPFEPAPTASESARAA